MKVFKSILAITLALAFTVPAFAGGNDKQPRNNARRMGALGTLKPSPVQTNY
jgi:hypothetical protein